MTRSPLPVHVQSAFDLVHCAEGVVSRFACLCAPVTRSHVEAILAAAASGSEEESVEDARDPYGIPSKRLTDSQLKNIYDNGTPRMRSLLSIKDRQRLELILSHQADDHSDDELDSTAAHVATRGAGA